jgi:hypothetical protein
MAVHDELPEQLLNEPAVRAMPAQLVRLEEAGGGRRSDRGAYCGSGGAQGIGRSDNGICMHRHMYVLN